MEGARDGEGAGQTDGSQARELEHGDQKMIPVNRAQGAGNVPGLQPRSWVGQIVPSLVTKAKDDVFYPPAKGSPS